jgi:hypothetical protein
VVSPDGGLLERAVHPFDLTVGPGVIGFSQTMLDAKFLPGPVEGMTAPAGGGTFTVLWQVGELDAVVCSPSAPLRQNEGLHEGRISGSS